MKKSLRKIITLLLVMSLLFGMTATTVVYATDGDGANSQNSTATQPESSAESSGGSAVNGWCDISYDENGVVITLTPDKEAILGITKSELKELLQTVIDAAKTLVIDDLRRLALGSDDPDFDITEDASGVTADNLWTMAINGYINKNPEQYPDGAEASYVKFLQNAINDESETVIGDFIDFACGLVESALAMGLISVEELPAPEDVENVVTETFNTKVNEFIRNKLPQYTDEYVLWLETGTPCSDPTIQNLISDQVKVYIEEKVLAYAENDFVSENDIVSTSIAQYLDNEIKTRIDAYIKNYANGDLDDNPPKVNTFIRNYFDRCIHEILVSWPGAADNPVSKIAHDDIEAAVRTKINEYIAEYFAGEISNSDIENEIDKEIKKTAPEVYWDYSDTVNKPQWVVIIDQKVEEAVRKAIEDEIRANLDECIAEIKASKKSSFEEEYEAENGVPPTGNQFNEWFDSYITSQEGQQKIDEKVLEKVDEEYSKLSKADIKNEINNNAEAKAKFDEEIEKAISKDNLTNLRNVWDSFGSVKQNNIIDSVIASDSTASAIENIVSEYCDDAFLQSSVDKLIASNEYADALAEFVAESKNDAEVKVILVDEIKAEIADTDKVFNTFRTAISYIKSNSSENYDDLISAIKDKVITESRKPETLEKAYNAYFDMSSNELQLKVEYFTQLLVIDYTVLYGELTASPERPKITPQLLLSYLDFVSITEDGVEYKLYADGQINVEALKDLALTLPTPSEIAEMSPADMKLDWTFNIATIFKEFEFDLTLILGGGYEHVTKLAGFIAEHLDVYVDGNGTLQVKLNVPAKFAELLVRAAKSDKIPETLKKKVFIALSKSPDDAYALFNELSFEDIISLIEKAPIDELLDKDFVSRFERLDNLTEAQIIEKIRDYQKYYEKLCDYVVLVYENYFPDKIKDNSIVDLYNGNGNFDIGGSYTLDIKKALIKISEKYGPTLASFISKTEVSVSAHLDVTFEDINKVEYRVNGAVVRKGFLPVGADLSYFAGVSYVDGYVITAWKDVDTGISYETMPDFDVELEPVYTKPIAIIVDSEGAPVTAVSKDYDGEAVELFVELDYAFTSPVFTYQWYKDGVAINGQTQNKLSVENVSENGEYYCIVSVKDGAIDDSFESSHVTVLISPIDVTGLEHIEWDYTGPYAYTGSDYTVLIDANTLPEFVAVDVGSYVDNVKSNAGTYTAKVALTVTNSNYKIPNGFTGLSLTWEIIASVLNLDTLEWAFLEGAELEYNTNTQTVYLKDIGNVQFTYEGNSAKNAGSYTARVTGYVNNDPNYQLVIGSVDNIPVLHWSITAKSVDLSDFEWDYAGKNFVYDGQTEYKVLLTDLGELSDYVAYRNNKSINAGTFIAEAYITSAFNTSELANNYDFGASEFTKLSWSVAKKQYQFVYAGWNETSFEYSGTSHEVYLVDSQGNRITDANITYTGNVATDVGNYVAYAVLSESAKDNFSLPEIKLEWKIDKKVIDISGLTWDYYEDKFTYNYGQEFTVSLENAGELVFVYTGNKGSDAKSYTAVATLDERYNDTTKYVIKDGLNSLSLDWEINKLTVQLGKLTWKLDGGAVYNGLAHSVYLVDVNGTAVLGVAYTNNSFTDAGTYVATVSFDNPNCIFEGQFTAQYTWTIEKGVFDLSGIVFEDAVVSYNGNAQTIAVTGLEEFISKYPGTTYKLEPNSATSVGAHIFTLTLSNKNYQDASLTAVLVIKPSTGLNIDRVFEVKDSFGNVILKITGQYGLTSDHTLNFIDVTEEYKDTLLPESLFAKGMDGKVVGAYDIHFKVAGWEKTVTDAFKVELLIPEGLRSVKDRLSVVYIAEDGSIEDMKATLSGDYLVFDTTHFSIYAIVDTFEKTVADEGGFPWLLLLAIIIIILALLIIIFVLLRKSKKPDDSEPNTPDTEAIEEPAEEASEATEEVKEEEIKEILPENTDESDISISGDVEIPVRYRHSFMSRLIQSEPPIQDYYTAVKNALLSYKGVKARISWNLESFNKGREQCAKLNVKGKNFLVYLNLDPKEYNVNKYHFQDVSGKPKVGDVPMLLKVKSDRGLKYAIELIYEMMSKLGYERIDTVPVDYHMPYETTEELAKRDLVKVILPQGVKLDKNSNLVKLDVGALLEDEKKADGKITALVTEETEITLPETDMSEETAEEPAVDKAPEVQEANEPEIKSDIIISGDVEIPVRYRHSFMSRLIQSEPPIQDYYTAVKNALLSYKGVKARISWNLESFNKGREQCAKLNVKGKNFLVYLNLDPKEYNVNKYHFQDVSGKPKVGDVPMLLKVKSDRGLKYAIELIYEMMSKLGYERIDTVPVDYHMPYETTEELAKRDLVKVILPQGVKLDKNSNLVKLDVGALLEDEKKADGKITALVTEETEITLSETEKTTADETTKADAVIEENLAVEAVEEHLAPINVQQADEMISDEEAAESILIIEREPKDVSRGNKMSEINIDTISENFNSGDTVTIKALKEKKLVPSNTGRIKVLARGSIDKRLIVIADKFSLQAVKMITLEGGIAERYRK